MPFSDTSATGPPFRSLLQLSMATGRGVEMLRRAIKRGYFQSTKPGTEHLFTPEQWQAALAYYGVPERDAEERIGHAASA